MLGSLIEGYLTALRQDGASLHTLRCYRVDLRHFAAWWAARGTALVESSDIRAYLAQLHESGYARRTVARKSSALRSFFRYCAARALIARDPTLDLPTIRPAADPPAFLALETVERLLDLPRGDTVLGARDRALLELLYATGLRARELVNLQVDDADLARGSVAVISRRGVERVVPMGAKAVGALSAYLATGRPCLAARATGGQALFLSRRGRRLSERSVSRILMGYVKTLSISARVSPYSIRHSCAAHMLVRGADMAAIQEMLGLSERTVAELYGRLSDVALRRVYRRSHPRAGGDAS